MIKKCIGCGLILQQENENNPGYTPDLKKDYCRRCFRLKNYGEKKKDQNPKEEQVLAKVNKGHGFAFFLVDFLNINKETINLYQKIKLPKALIISKSDTLRKDMKKEKIKLWLKEVYHIEEPILFINNKDYIASDNIFKIMDAKNYNSAYILGITNAGKSTFLNKLLKSYRIKREILASNKPNTTLDFIKLKIGEYTLYDTPGFSYQNDHLSLITKEIKPITFQIKENTTLKIHDICLFFKEENQVTFYGTEQIKREYHQKEEPYTLKIPKNHDIVFPGIGFLNIKQESIVLANQPNLEIRKDLSEDTYE